MYHQIIIVGNVGKDAEMRYTPNGAAVTAFSVATNNKYTNANGEQISETIWWRITAWNKQAEICNQYVKKGMKILIEGHMVFDKTTGGPKIWTKQDGTPGSSFEINPRTIKFLSSKQDNGGTGMDQSAPEAGMDQSIPVSEEDIPF